MLVEQWSRSSSLFVEKEKNIQYTVYPANNCGICPTAPLALTTMSNKLNFGQYDGKTFEWLFFHNPQYAEWIYDNGIHRQEHNFDEQEAERFLELYCRASSLGGVCCQCKAKPVARMGLTTHFRGGAVGAVGFYCDTCEFRGGSCTGYYPPSFIVEAYTLSSADQKMLLSEIQRHYLGDGNLTRRKMEEFFHNDANFTEATGGFFDGKEVTQ